MLLRNTGLEDLLAFVVVDIVTIVYVAINRRSSARVHYFQSSFLSVLLYTLPFVIGGLFAAENKTNVALGFFLPLLFLCTKCHAVWHDYALCFAAIVCIATLSGLSNPPTEGQHASLLSLLNVLGSLCLCLFLKKRDRLLKVDRMGFFLSNGMSGLPIHILAFFLLWWFQAMRWEEMRWDVVLWRSLAHLVVLWIPRKAAPASLKMMRAMAFVGLWDLWGVPKVVLTSSVLLFCVEVLDRSSRKILGLCSALAFLVLTHSRRKEECIECGQFWAIFSSACPLELVDTASSIVHFLLDASPGLYVFLLNVDVWHGNLHEAMLICCVKGIAMATFALREDGCHSEPLLSESCMISTAAWCWTLQQYHTSRWRAAGTWWVGLWAFVIVCNQYTFRNYVGLPLLVSLSVGVLMSILFQCYNPTQWSYSMALFLWCATGLYLDSTNRVLKGLVCSLWGIAVTAYYIWKKRLYEKELPKSVNPVLPMGKIKKPHFAI